MRTFNYYNPIPEADLENKVRELFSLDPDDTVTVRDILGGRLDIVIEAILFIGMDKIRELEKYTSRKVIELHPFKTPKYWAGVQIHLSHEI